jgi:altronate dehydratase small subunit
MTAVNKSKWEAVVMNEKDQIATALKKLASGSTVQVKFGKTLSVCVVNEDIPMCHKFSVADIPVGDSIRKYGEVIGVASVEIATGRHVHVHNIKSLRAKTP